MMLKGYIFGECFRFEPGGTYKIALAGLRAGCLRRLPSTALLLLMIKSAASRPLHPTFTLLIVLLSD